MNNSVNFDSDKSYWHRYTKFYERIFHQIPDPAVIVEFGVLNSDSIKWLRNMFPDALIHGVDILKQKDGWYEDERIRYHKVDQSSDREVNHLFTKLEAADLIIDDGSHIPEHQARCLASGFKTLNSGGVYVVEDLQTSLIEILNFSKRPFFKGKTKVNTLSLLLAIEHLQYLDEKTTQVIETLSDQSYFDREMVEYFLAQIDEIEIFRRTLLPKKCFNCGTNIFDYRLLKCSCGTDIYSPVDSMTCAISKT
jgi:hypothetical protein